MPGIEGTGRRRGDRAYSDADQLTRLCRIPDRAGPRDDLSCAGRLFWYRYYAGRFFSNRSRSAAG